MRVRERERERAVNQTQTDLPDGLSEKRGARTYDNMMKVTLHTKEVDSVHQTTVGGGVNWLTVKGGGGSRTYWNKTRNQYSRCESLPSSEA